MRWRCVPKQSCPTHSRNSATAFLLGQSGTLLFLASMVFGITLSPVHVCALFGTPVLNVVCVLWCFSNMCLWNFGTLSGKRIGTFIPCNLTVSWYPLQYNLFMFCLKLSYWNYCSTYSVLCVTSWHTHPWLTLLPTSFSCCLYVYICSSCKLTFHAPLKVAWT